PESDRRFGGRSRFGNHIDTDLLILQQLQEMGRVNGAEVMADKINLRSLSLFPGKLVVKAVIQHLQRRAGTQIGTADADHHERIGIGPDATGGLLDPGELFPVVVRGEIHPSEKIAAHSRAAVQHLLGRLDKGFQLLDFVIPDKGSYVRIVKGENRLHGFLPHLVVVIDHSLYQKTEGIHVRKVTPVPIHHPRNFADDNAYKSPFQEMIAMPRRHRLLVPESADALKRMKIDI